MLLNHNSSKSFLVGSIQLKKSPTAKFIKARHPWVYSNELTKIDKTLPAGSWVSLEDQGGRKIAYGYFNPHSLIAFRAFERVAFVSEDQTRALFFKRLDDAWQLRTRTYGALIATEEMGRHSFRLCFGESDGLPGLVIDLYEGGSSGVAVIQSHAAGADQFIFWAQQWLEERMGISAGVIRNDVEVRKREGVKLEVVEWGKLPSKISVLEGGVKFSVDPRGGQKTGYFYDHRDNRARFASLAANFDSPAVLDCFSYVGSWGLQILKKNPKARLTAVDVSKTALSQVQANAAENGFKDRVEVIEADLFKDKSALGSRKFDTVISDPPSLTSSAKHLNEGKRAHENCFAMALKHLADNGVADLASCSFHLTWDDFMDVVNHAGQACNQTLRISHIGSQSADHPVLSTLPETRYLKSVIVEKLRT